MASLLVPWHDHTREFPFRQAHEGPVVFAAHGFGGQAQALQAAAAGDPRLAETFYG